MSDCTRLSLLFPCRVPPPVDDTVIQIQDIVSRHLPPLQLLPDTLLAGAVQMFVEKNDADAIDEVRVCNGENTPHSAQYECRNVRSPSVNA